jgi:hypothetical protein
MDPENLPDVRGGAVPSSLTAAPGFQQRHSAVANAASFQSATGREPCTRVAASASVADKTDPVFHVQEQRLRSPLQCTPLTSGNEFPHTMIGGPLGADGLIAALFLVGRLPRDA